MKKTGDALKSEELGVNLELKNAYGESFDAMYEKHAEIGQNDLDMTSGFYDADERACIPLAEVAVIITDKDLNELGFIADEL